MRENPGPIPDCDDDEHPDDMSRILSGPPILSYVVELESGHIFDEGAGTPLHLPHKPRTTPEVLSQVVSNPIGDHDLAPRRERIA